MFEELDAAINKLKFALITFGFSILSQVFDVGFLKMLCLFATFAFIGLAYRHSIIRFFQKIWPFVLKSTAARVIKREKEISRQTEHTRILFKKYDDLFKELPPIQLTKDSKTVAAGFALIDTHGKPTAISKFQLPRVMIPYDQLSITIGANLVPSPFEDTSYWAKRSDS